MKTLFRLAAMLLASLSVSTILAETAAQRGYRLLTEKAYLPPDFDQDVFDQLWRRWDEPLRSEAAKATPEQRRKMAFDQYGLTTRPGDISGKPLQYVVDDQGNWSMNCFACHGGSFDGQIIPGRPNTNFDLQTLTEDVRITKVRLTKQLGRLDKGSLVIPLSTARGTTNAVVFGVVLLAYRDAELNVLKNPPRIKLVHHDMDAPAWWSFHRRKMLYVDGHAPKTHRALMQFLLVRANGPEKFREWEAEFKDVYAYLDSLRPPKYPYKIDRKLADAGESIFDEHCSKCHGHYGENARYRQPMIPIDVIGTDSVRHKALSLAHLEHLRASWFTRHGKDKVLLKPTGYSAPPLDGVWASAPYLHNGSVPTLWHLLHPKKRPVVWVRRDNSLDRKRVGLNVAELTEVPKSARSLRAQRQHFDTRAFGKRATGHDFPGKLSEDQRRSVLEYLKTL